ncbi:uncharacterized protein LOC112637495 [Camponotus floridanus]|uniref:uncharacterized protein LOC112637495 n=1 Tax=Camponotus floridanus TaxID=104421 RepID=UPI000DC679FC|nr:uncharacterized protein LOC112637495 [Camponotus floridanus]
MIEQLRKLKKGTVQEENGIENEAWRLMPKETGEVLFKLLTKIWKEGEILKEWIKGKYHHELILQCQRKNRNVNATSKKLIVAMSKDATRLPFKGNIAKLGDSRRKVQMIKSFSRKFASDPSYTQSYSEFINEYEKLQHLKLVQEGSINSESHHHYYLPHHGVVRERSLQFCCVFSLDIEKMYRQIKINSEDWDFQRILWINQSNDIITYQLTTVTYELAYASFIALRTLKQLVDEGDKFPLAIQVLTKERYVDDLFGGSDTIQQAKNIIKDVNQLWRLPLTKKITKRAILSTIAKLFDPLELLSPVIIKAKIIIQELWSVKLAWDDPLPSPMSNRWTVFVEQLQEMPSLSFPRWLDYKSDHHIELYGFCDASQQTMSAVIYLRSTSTEGEVQTNIICSTKTKVALLKRITIPRLKLSGAVLLTKLTSHIIRILELDNVPVHLWTDSSITYTWINNHPNLSILHAGKISCITEFVIFKKRYFKLFGTLFQVMKISLTSLSMWPKEPQAISSKYNLEEQQVRVSTINTNHAIEPWNLLNRYSDLNRLLRITAVIQQYHFQQEIKTLSKRQPLPKSNSLLKLTFHRRTFSEGLLRIGGRLKLPSSAKHPLILPKKSTLTQLIIADAHLRTMHGGTQLTLSFIRNNYWIIGSRTPVRSHILKCVRCARSTNESTTNMGQLQVEKLTSSRPFLKTRIELVTDYTTDAFIAAYKRFTARRRICATLMSDCGTNLKGTDSELKNLFSIAFKELGNLAAILAKDGTQWKFNPVFAPHFGGKWEAGIKSVKYYLKRIIGDALLAYEEISTLLTQIEAVLNSQPLSSLSDNPEDLNALIPAHFLIGSAAVIIPEPSLETIKSSRLSRWQLLQQMLDNFWRNEIWNSKSNNSRTDSHCSYMFIGKTLSKAFDYTEASMWASDQHADYSLVQVL